MPDLARHPVSAFLLAAVATAAAASVFSTQFVIAALADIGVVIPVGVRLMMTVTDLRILVLLAPAAAASFVPAFAVAEFITRTAAGHREFWFALAGGTGFVTALLIAEAVLGLMPVGGARSAAGLGLQGVAGIAGGWLFGWLTAKPAPGEGG